MNIDVEKLVMEYLARRRARLTRGILISAALFAGGIAIGFADKTWGVLVAALAGVLLAALIWQRSTATKDRGAEILRTRRDEIVWAYYLVNHGLVFGLRSGEKALLGNAEPWLLEQLAPVLGHATLGFTPEHATTFGADPSRLARSNG